MNDTEIRTTIAEACGWEFTKEGEPFTRNSLGKPVYRLTPDPVPDYLNDLNAMHEAEETLDENKRTIFYWTLSATVLKDSVPPNCTFLVAHATARDRAEAFLKTIGKWKDETK